MKKCLVILVFFCIGFAANSQTTDASGKKQGYWKKVDEKSNKLIYEGLFKDDKPQGLFKYYYPFDTVKARIYFREDGKYSFAKLYHPNGKMMAQGKYIGESIKDSVWCFYDELGVLMSRDAYSLGKKHGKCLVYFPDGKVAEESNYKMDVLHGAFLQYFDGKKIKSEVNYVNGKKEGKNTFYYPNGVAAATGYFKNGLKTGPWIYKSHDGKVSDKELYEYGILMDKKKTDEFFSKNKVKDDAPVKSQEKSTEKKPTPKKS